MAYLGHNKKVYGSGDAELAQTIYSQTGIALAVAPVVQAPRHGRADGIQAHMNAVAHGLCIEYQEGLTIEHNGRHQFIGINAAGPMQALTLAENY